MKKTTFYILLAGLFASTGLAYTYEVYTYGDNKTLYDGESILVDLQGGMDRLTLNVDSTAIILGSSAIEQGLGGIWEIRLGYTSNLYMVGGEVNMLNIGNEATAILKGGLIQSIYSYQIVPDPHITLYHSGAVPTKQNIGGFDFLVGQWGNGDPFSIYLHNTGYDVYGNF